MTKEHQERKAAYDKIYRLRNRDKRRAWAKSEREKARRRKHYHEVLRIQQGRGPRCKFPGELRKIRTRELARAYGSRNRDKRRAYYRENRERLLLQKSDYYRRNRLKINASHRDYLRRKKLLNPSFRLQSNLRTEIGRFIKGQVKKYAARSEALIGCTWKEFRSHVESLFTDGMSWDNYGRNGWHLDHITPISHFDLLDPEQLRLAFHWSNTRPLWAIDNLRKGNRHRSPPLGQLPFLHLL